MTGGADGAGGNEFRLGACTYNVNSVRHGCEDKQCTSRLRQSVSERYDARSESTMRARDACLAARNATMAL